MQIEGDRRHRVGTLVYTRGALLTVAFWMLWADLCLQIMEQLPAVIPIQLRALGASDVVVSLIKDSLMALLAVALVPFIGMQSDRHRGRLGRRRPFLLWCIFPVCGFLVALGFVEPITRFVFSFLKPLGNGTTEAGTGIVLIGIFATGFLAFNTYVLQIFQYMIADVVPKEALGRFFGVFRAVGALGGFIFNRWIFGYVDTQIWAVYAGSAFLYATAFLLLVWRVKEGDYPEPVPQERNIVLGLLRYCRECYSNPFYLKLFLTSAMFWTAFAPFNTFIFYYATQGPDPTYAPTLNMDAAAFGEMKSWIFVPKVAVALLIGPVIDRLDALRVLGLAFAGIALMYAIGFFVADAPLSLTLWWVAEETISVIFLVAYSAIFPMLLPAERYGQYFGANQVFFSIWLIFTPPICGVMLQYVKDYAFVFVWAAAFSAAGAAMAIWLYRDWVKLGRIPPD